MIIYRKPLILDVDAIGGAALLVLLALEIFFVVIPFFHVQSEIPQLRAQVLAARHRKDLLFEQQTTLEKKLATARARLDARADESFADYNRFLERLSHECSDAGVQLEEFQPLATTARIDFQSWDVRVRARGRFPDLQRVVSAIETWSTNNSVRELTVTPLAADRTDVKSPCLFDWIVRVNYLPPRPFAGAVKP